MDTRFERTKGEIEYFTPPEIIKALGPFDLDPCSSNRRPFNTAKIHFFSGGLQRKWTGRIWLNPPYGNQARFWLDKLAIHGNGIALTYARTETEKMFFRYVWPSITGIMFLKGRLHFYDLNGKRLGPAGSPSCLLAYGIKNALILKNSDLEGHFLWNNKPDIFKLIYYKFILCQQK
jgi:hypothetical protein